jgi:hypothetical protein
MENLKELEELLGIEAVSFFNENRDKFVETLDELLKIKLKLINLPTIYNSLIKLNYEDREKYHLHIIDKLEIFKKGQDPEIYLIVKCIFILFENDITILHNIIKKECEDNN